jgi:GAF domain-containing protein
MAAWDSHGRLIGGINLYASTPDAFTGLHDAVADAVGGMAASAVTDADLGFASRERARQAPSVLRARGKVDTATGLLAARYDSTIDEARARLERAAERAGLDPAVVAQVLILAEEG